MKITNLTTTLFKWAIEPWKTRKHNFGGDIQLGVVTVHTDEGIEGHAFLEIAQPGRGCAGRSTDDAGQASADRSESARHRRSVAGDVGPA